MRKFYVGIPSHLKPKDQLIIKVCPFANGYPEGLKDVRQVTAKDEPAATVLYCAMFGKKAAMRPKPS